MSKPQPLSLETIYEESGSFVASTGSIPHKDGSETSNGLISSRSIPTVDIQQKRANEKHQKPPIEVRFRDGTKRYIHPSTTPTMIINRKNLLDSSHDNLSSKNIINSNYQQIIHSNFNKKNFQTKPPLVVTIITAEDLRRFGTISALSSSSDGSETSTVTRSKTISPTEKIKTLDDNHQAQPVINNSTQNLHSPASLLSNSSQQQVITNHHQNLTSSQSFSSSSSSQSSTIPTQLLSVQNPKVSTSSFRVNLTNDENEKNLSLKSNLTNKIVNHTVQTNTAILVDGRIRSAFRPFLKSVRFNPETFSIKPEAPSPNNEEPINPIQKPQQQVVPYSQNNQKQYPPVSTTSVSYQPTTKQNNVVVPKSPYDSISPTQIKFDIAKNSSLNINSLIQMYPSIYQQQSKSSNNYLDNSWTLPRVLNLSPKSDQTVSFAVNPNMQWFNITSNSIYDIPHLSSKYSSMPLLITLPVVNSTYNQKLVNKHNPALEKRLLNAGLSPETVALYERILDIAENCQMNIVSPPKLINQYPYKTYI